MSETKKQEPRLTMAFNGSIAGRAYMASGNSSSSEGRLSVFGENADESVSEWGTITWNGSAPQRMLEISRVLHEVAAELQSAVEDWLRSKKK